MTSSLNGNFSYGYDTLDLGEGSTGPKDELDEAISSALLDRAVSKLHKTLDHEDAFDFENYFGDQVAAEPTPEEIEAEIMMRVKMEAFGRFELEPDVGGQELGSPDTGPYGDPFVPQVQEWAFVVEPGYIF